MSSVPPAAPPDGRGPATAPPDGRGPATAPPDGRGPATAPPDGRGPATAPDWPEPMIPLRRRRRPEPIGIKVTCIGLATSIVAALVLGVAWGLLTTKTVDLQLTGQGATGTYQATYRQGSAPVGFSGELNVHETVNPLGQQVRIDASGGGNLTCTITIDGEVAKTTDGSGDATCGMRLWPWS